MVDSRDRFGIGYRPEILAGILSHLDRIDLVEAIADDLLNREHHLSALRTLAGQLPLTLHGLSLGLAGASPVSPRRLDDFARWVGVIRPESWSEHLAFVRAGGIEIGHLAAPPRRPVTIENAARNILRAAQVVGTLPAVENIATLVSPPGSTLSEAEWVTGILRATGAPMLLDLHNLHANAHNFGFDAVEYLDSLPLQAIRQVHIAGGRSVPLRGAPGERIIDDHLHRTPERVFDLLAHLAEKAPQPLTIMLERDGHYPAFQVLLDELDQARAAVAAGRRKRAVRAAQAGARAEVAA